MIYQSHMNISYQIDDLTFAGNAYSRALCGTFVFLFTPFNEEIAIGVRSKISLCHNFQLHFIFNYLLAKI